MDFVVVSVLLATCVCFLIGLRNYLKLSREARINWRLFYCGSSQRLNWLIYLLVVTNSGFITILIGENAEVS
jgi:hypothetical protein